jgi:hypothetical protein
MIIDFFLIDFLYLTLLITVPFMHYVVNKTVRVVARSVDLSKL